MNRFLGSISMVALLAFCQNAFADSTLRLSTRFTVRHCKYNACQIDISTPLERHEVRLKTVGSSDPVEIGSIVLTKEMNGRKFFAEISFAKRSDPVPSGLYYNVDATLGESALTLSSIETALPLWKPGSIFLVMNGTMDGENPDYISPSLTILPEK